jgi:hypothetical protein
MAERNFNPGMRPQIINQVRKYQHPYQGYPCSVLLQAFIKQRIHLSDNNISLGYFLSTNKKILVSRTDSLNDLIQIWGGYSFYVTKYGLIVTRINDILRLGLSG